MALATSTALALAATAASTGASIFGASKAAGAAGDAHAQNAALFREMFGKAEGWLDDYINRGNDAGGMYMDALMGGPKAQAAFETYRDSAGYRSNLAEGINATNTNAANRKLLNSGSALKNVTRFATDLNQRYYDSWLTKLALPQQLGAASAGSLASGAFNFANLGAQNNNNLADARGNAWLAGTSALSSGLQGLGSAFGGFGGSGYGG